MQCQIWFRTAFRHFHNNKFISASKEEILSYKKDSQTLLNWLDVSIIKKKGRAYSADLHLREKTTAEKFIKIKAYTILDKSCAITAPDDFFDESKVRLVVFSFKQYGFTLLRSWIDPFRAKFCTPPSKKVKTIEICFVQYGFLSFFQSLFAQSVRGQISDPEQQASTALSFGGVEEAASQLLLPNQYTGYAYLLDGEGRVRWKGCGEALPHEIDALLSCTHSLLMEEQEQEQKVNKPHRTHQTHT
jgi:ATPase complex subunit ATP10